MQLTGVEVCEIILPDDKYLSIFRRLLVSEIEQHGVEQTAVSDYPTYLRQKSLNAALTRSAVLASGWLALGATVLSIAVFTRPDADVVGMDPAGREHPIVVNEMPPSAGAKR